MVAHPVSIHSSTQPVPIRPLGSQGGQAAAAARATIYRIADVVVLRLIDVQVWCERAERLHDDHLATDRVHDLHAALACRKLRQAADLATDATIRDLLRDAARNLELAEEHNARDGAICEAVGRIVARISKRARGLCAALDARLPRAGKRGGK